MGAAVAVVMGAGGLTIAGASSAPSSFVPITPARIIDTRTAIGLSGPFVSPTGRSVQVTGTVQTASGPTVVVPTGATAVVLNVTAVRPQAAGFISVRPGGTPGAPETSSLNFAAGDIVPNAVTVALSAGGAIDVVYDALGGVGPTTEALIDVTGYYTAVGAGEPGPAGPRGPAGATGQRGVSAWDTIPSGVTVTGYETWDFESTGTGGDFVFSVSFPARAPAVLTDGDINFAASSGSAPLIGDGDPTCTGTTDAPTAPTGKVCLYLVGSLRASGYIGFSNHALADHGFRVRWVGAADTANVDMYARVTWAYTAP